MFWPPGVESVEVRMHLNSWAKRCTMLQRYNLQSAEVHT